MADAVEGKMRMVEVDVVFREGKTKGSLMVCSCTEGAALFFVFAVAGHTHLQCQACGSVYCQGQGQCR